MVFCFSKDLSDHCVFQVVSHNSHLPLKIVPLHKVSPRRMQSSSGSGPGAEAARTGFRLGVSSCLCFGGHRCVLRHSGERSAHQGLWHAPCRSCHAMPQHTESAILPCNRAPCLPSVSHSRVRKDAGVFRFCTICVDVEPPTPLQMDVWPV
jgi:hypothetical protein